MFSLYVNLCLQLTVQELKSKLSNGTFLSMIINAQLLVCTHLPLLCKKLTRHCFMIYKLEIRFHRVSNDLHTILNIILFAYNL